MNDNELQRRAIDEAEAENALIRSGICPRCRGNRMRGEPDKRQAGPSKVQGVWVNYRCDDCGYACDLVEMAG